MNVAKFLELAQALPGEKIEYLNEPFISDAYAPLILSDEINRGLYALRENSPEKIRISFKVVYQKTVQDGKYGDILELYYLDDKPYLLMHRFSRYLTVSHVYIIDQETHAASRDWLLSLYDKTHPEEKLEMLSDDILIRLVDGGIVEDPFPFISEEF